MNHEQAQEALWELYDGELAPSKRRDVEGHLAQCAECRRDLEAWRGAARAFFAKPAQPHPAKTEAFVLRVMERVQRGGARAGWLRWLRPAWLVPALGAGLAAALAIPGLRAVPDPAQAMIQSQAGGQSFWSFLSQSAPSTHDEVLAFVEGER